MLEPCRTLRCTKQTVFQVCVGGSVVEVSVGRVDIPNYAMG